MGSGWTDHLILWGGNLVCGSHVAHTSGTADPPSRVPLYAKLPSLLVSTPIVPMVAQRQTLEVEAVEGGDGSPEILASRLRALHQTGRRALTGRP